MKKLFIITGLALLVIALAIFILNYTMKKGDLQTSSGAQEYWPSGSWRTSVPEEQGMDSGMLADMIASIKEDGKSVNSITIIRHGYLVNETYFYPYQRGMKHSLNSATKSFVSALVGVAINEGKIKSLNDKVLDYFPNMYISNIDQQKQDMSIKNLMDMSSGLNWEFTNNVSTNQMLQSRDWTKFTLDLPMREQPGNAFNYSNGAAHVVSSILQKTMGRNTADLVADKLKIGIKDISWLPSPEGVSSGYSGIYMQPGDMAKLGYLYLKKGNWNGKQLIPEKWVEESTKTQIKADWNPIFPGYGYMWWISRFGGYAALGFGGQYIFVVPEKDLVVVFTSGLYPVNDLFYPGELMENYIIPSIKSADPLPANQTAAVRLQNTVRSVQTAPPPQPAGQLPETAERISGKTFVMDDSQTFGFGFKGGNECTIDFNSQYKLKIGLDDDYRLNDTGNIPVPGVIDPAHNAMKGRWLDEKTFQVTSQILEDGFVTVYTIKFEGDRMEMKIKYNLSDFESTLSGAIRK